MARKAVTAHIVTKSGFVQLPVSLRASFVYRVIPIARLYELFERQENVLVSPRCWKDPFEHFVLQSKKTLHRSWFGQCWTRHAASDAMWRIYSPESEGVRIRSTPQKLMESLESAFGDSPRFVGRVQYMPTKRLTQYAKKALSLKNPVGAAQTLLVKRPAFRHEREVRLLVRRADEKSDCLRCRFDPHDLLDQIMVDPRLEVTKARSLQDEIRKRTGFHGKVLRSLLYAPPPPLA